MKGVRYTRAGNYVQFGSDAAGGEFDPDMVDYLWDGEAGVAVFLDGLIKWPDGQVSETTYDPFDAFNPHPDAIDITWRGERTTWHLDGPLPKPVVYEPIEELVVDHDAERRLVFVTVGNKRMTMSPEKAEELMARMKYHATRSRDRKGV